MLLFSLSFSADEIYDTVSGEIEKEAEFYIPEESEKTAENFGETLSKENAASFFDIKKLFSFFMKIMKYLSRHNITIIKLGHYFSDGNKKFSIETFNFF